MPGSIRVDSTDATTAAGSAIGSPLTLNVRWWISCTSSDSHHSSRSAVGPWYMYREE